MLRYSARAPREIPAIKIAKNVVGQGISPRKERTIQKTDASTTAPETYLKMGSFIKRIITKDRRGGKI